MRTHTFESALAAAVAVVQEAEGFSDVAKVLLVRDLRGRIRLVWEPSAGASGPAVQEVEATCRRELGGWFLGPILVASNAGGAEAAGVARSILSFPEVRPFPVTELQDPRTSTPLTVARSWRFLSRRLTKESWLSGTPTAPPWPLARNAPSIVSFHSFKGGVGRSTALSIVAVQLSRLGKRVLCIDLDLESPGLDRVFDVDADRGILDSLLEAAVLGEAELDDVVRTATVRKCRIDVVPAGYVDTTYIEKLGRLDYLGAAEGGVSVEAGLRRILLQLRRHRPDFVLIDNRSGLSDLAGISLAALAHVDVLVARGNGQGEMGLSITLPLMAARRAPQDRRFVLVHSMAPTPLDGPASISEQERLRVAAWRAYAGTVPESSDVAAVGDSTGAHYPIVLPELDEVKRAEAVTRLEDSTLRSERYALLTERIIALCTPEEEEE